MNHGTQLIEQHFHSYLEKTLYKQDGDDIFKVKTGDDGKVIIQTITVDDMKNESDDHKHLPELVGPLCKF